MSLLQQHPDIHMDHERRVLHKRGFKVRFPDLYLNGLSQRSRKPTYIAKTHINRIAYQGSDPLEILTNLQSQGWKFVYLYRANLLEQAVSHLIVKHRKVIFDVQSDALKNHKYMLPIPELEHQLLRGKERLVREMAIANAIGCKMLEYGKDLATPQAQAKTIKSLLSFLDVAELPLSSPIQKTSSGSWQDDVQNAEEIVQFIKQSPFFPYLNKDCIPS